MNANEENSAINKEHDAAEHSAKPQTLLGVPIVVSDDFDPGFSVKDLRVGRARFTEDDEAE